MRTGRGERKAIHRALLVFTEHLDAVLRRLGLEVLVWENQPLVPQIILQRTTNVMQHVPKEKSVFPMKIGEDVVGKDRGFRPHSRSVWEHQVVALQCLNQ